MDDIGISPKELGTQIAEIGETTIADAVTGDTEPRHRVIINCKTGGEKHALLAVLKRYDYPGLAIIQALKSK